MLYLSEMEDYFVDYMAETIKNNLIANSLKENESICMVITKNSYTIIKKIKDKFIAEYTNTPFTEKQIERVNNIINSQK